MHYLEIVKKIIWNKSILVRIWSSWAWISEKCDHVFRTSLYPFYHFYA